MGVSKYIHITKKLQMACRRSFGKRLLIDQKQWYSVSKDMATTVYVVYEVTDTKVIDGRKRDVKVELFRTHSQVQLLLFMRDYWYILNGWEVPTDNAKWEEVKQEYGQAPKKA